MAQALDVPAQKTVGNPVPVAEGVLNIGAGTGGAFSASANGVLAYWGGDHTEASRLVWFGRDGRQTPSEMPAATYGRISINRDGSQAAVEQVDASGAPAIWLIDLSRGTPTRFTWDAFSIWPIWSPDGRSVLFSSMRSGALVPYQQPVAAVDTSHSLFDAAAGTVATDWSARDGILYQTGDYPNDQIGVFTGSQRTLLHTAPGVSDGRFSPSGRLMAYVSANEVYVTSFPDLTGNVHISVAGGGQPRWGADDTELFYLAADRRVMRVALAPTAQLDHAAPVPMFDAVTDDYAVTADGRRFLLVIRTEAKPPALPFTVVVNWLPSSPRSSRFF